MNMSIGTILAAAAVSITFPVLSTAQTASAADPGIVQAIRIAGIVLMVLGGIAIIKRFWNGR